MCTNIYNAVDVKSNAGVNIINFRIYITLIFYQDIINVTIIMYIYILLFMLDFPMTSIYYFNWMSCIDSIPLLMV